VLEPMPQATLQNTKTLGAFTSSEGFLTPSQSVVNKTVNYQNSVAENWLSE